MIFDVVRNHFVRLTTGVRAAALISATAIPMITSSAHAVSSVNLLTLTGTVAYEQFGMSVASAGDVNGDGFADLIVGAPTGSSAVAGRAYVYYGGPTADTTPDLTLTGVPNDIFGISVASAGDVNGDGFADVIVGACGRVCTTGRQSCRRDDSVGHLGREVRLHHFDELGEYDTFHGSLPRGDFRSCNGFTIGFLSAVAHTAGDRARANADAAVRSER